MIEEIIKRHFSNRPPEVIGILVSLIKPVVQEAVDCERRRCSMIIERWLDHLENLEAHAERVQKSGFVVDLKGILAMKEQVLRMVQQICETPVDKPAGLG